jgi:hypothetical protein
MRTIILLILAFGSAAGWAQSTSMNQSVQSIGAGPFEIPISGSFNFSREGGATVLATPDDKLRITIGFFRNPAATGEPSAQASKVESIVQRNWERFAAEEKGRVVRPFKKETLPNDLTVFSMATEFQVQGEVHYYVQFAVTDGLQVASLFFEGLGSAAMALNEFEPKVHRVKKVQASN